MIYNTIFFKSVATGGNVSSALAEAGQNACYQTLISNQGCVFLLGNETLYEIHLRDWSERIDFYVENNKNQYEQALELAYSMLIGKAKGLTGKIRMPTTKNTFLSRLFFRFTNRSTQTPSMYIRSNGLLASILSKIHHESRMSSIGQN